MLRWLGIVLVGGGGFVLIARWLFHFSILSDYGILAPAVAATALLVGLFLIWSGGLD